MSKGDNLGTRMKTYYENISRQSLYRKIPVIMRLDGKAFHTFTKGSKKPFDHTIVSSMQDTAEFLIRNIQGAKVAYVQSDEISILITDYDAIETEAWYDYNVQKMTSVSASMAGVQFSVIYATRQFPFKFTPAYFDSRVFNIPKEDVINCFRWRYQDWKRNSIAMLAQSLYSQKELNGKNSGEQIVMCSEKGQEWGSLDSVYRNGTLFHWAGIDGHRYLNKTSEINLNSNAECASVFEELV